MKLFPQHTRIIRCAEAPAVYLRRLENHVQKHPEQFRIREQGPEGMVLAVAYGFLGYRNSFVPVVTVELGAGELTMTFVLHPHVKAFLSVYLAIAALMTLSMLAALDWLLLAPVGMAAFAVVMSRMCFHRAVRRVEQTLCDVMGVA